MYGYRRESKQGFSDSGPHGGSLLRDNHSELKQDVRLGLADLETESVGPRSKSQKFLNLLSVYLHLPTSLYIRLCVCKSPQVQNRHSGSQA